MGVVRDVVSGQMDVDEENYGIFDGKTLIASLLLQGPQSEDDDCPTPFWAISMIEVTNQFQRQGIGPRLLDAVFALHRRPMASDLDQDGGGADLWRRWIRDNPGKVELFSPTGSLGIVAKNGASYAPDPWACRKTRLVRMP